MAGRDTLPSQDSQTVSTIPTRTKWEEVVNAFVYLCIGISILLAGYLGGIFSTASEREPIKKNIGAGKMAAVKTIFKTCNAKADNEEGCTSVIDQIQVIISKYETKEENPSNDSNHSGNAKTRPDFGSSVLRSSSHARNERSPETISIDSAIQSQ